MAYSQRDQQEAHAAFPMREGGLDALDKGSAVEIEGGRGNV